VAADVKAMKATLKQSTEKVEGHGCKLLKDNSFLLPDLLNDLRKKEIQVLQGSQT
jgi:hypothetical protein